MEILKTLLIGIVEGITEWLPVSSTGHMILVDEFVKLKVSPEFLKMFLVVIQLGAILAVVCLYFNKLNPFSGKKSKTQKIETFNIWGKVIVGVIPAAVAGLLLDDFMDAHFYNWQTVSLTLIIYGILFIVLENRNKNKAFKIKSFKHLNYKTAFTIGCFQILSLVPGTSRSGSTILGAMLIGTNREIAAEYSFFLAIPVMFGASFLKVLKYILETGFTISTNEIQILLTGLISAFVVSILAIKFLIKYIKKNDFKAFGIYRIILGIIVVLYFILV